MWSLPAAAPGMSQSGARGAPGQDAGGLSIIGSVALELELTGHGLSSLGTGKPGRAPGHFTAVKRNLGVTACPAWRAGQV
jgi:hypothetical protein